MPSSDSPSVLTISAPTLCSARSDEQLAYAGVRSDRDDGRVGLGLEDVGDAHGFARYPREPRLQQGRTQSSGTTLGSYAAGPELRDRAGPAGPPVRVVVHVGHRAQERQRRVVQVAVGGERVAAPGAVLAGQGGEHAARLAHDHVDGRHVVHLQLGLGGQVDGALGDEHVGPEVAVGPGPPDPPHQRDEVVHLAALLPAVQGRVGQRRVLEAAYVGDVALRGLEQRAAGPRAVAGRGPPAPLELRGRDDAEHDLVVDGERDQGGPDGDAADEVLGAVDRVHDPAPLAVAGRALLLAGDGVPRPDPRQGAADGLLDGLVGVGDRRQVGLAHDVQVEGLEPVRGRGVRIIGEDVREAQIVGVVRHASHTILTHPHNVDTTPRNRGGGALARSLSFARMEINGLPVHALVVHAAVVFGPLAALAGVALRRSRSGATSCAGRSVVGRRHRVRVDLGRLPVAARSVEEANTYGGELAALRRDPRGARRDAAPARVRLRRGVVRGRLAARADRPGPARCWPARGRRPRRAHRRSG